MGKGRGEHSVRAMSLTCGVDGFHVSQTTRTPLPTDTHLTFPKGRQTVSTHTIRRRVGTTASPHARITGASCWCQSHEGSKTNLNITVTPKRFVTHVQSNTSARKTVKQVPRPPSSPSPSILALRIWNAIRQGAPCRSPHVLFICLSLIHI